MGLFQVEIKVLPATVARRRFNFSGNRLAGDCKRSESREMRKNGVRRDLNLFESGFQRNGGEKAATTR